MVQVPDHRGDRRVGIVLAVFAQEADVEIQPDRATGFGNGGATIEDVRLMRETVGDSMGVKASGGIRDLKTALAMIEAGATRLGTSGSVAIISELAKSA